MNVRDTMAAALERSTGAAAGGAALVLITLERIGDRFAINRQKSAYFVLQDHSQDGLWRLHDELNEFTTDAGIKELVLRTSKRAGQYATGSSVRRMEAALELLRGVIVRRVNDQSLGPWTEIHAHELPAADADLAGQTRKLHEAAIASARLAHGVSVGGVKLVKECVR